MENEFTSQSLAEAFAEHRARLLSLVEKRLNPILLKRLSHDDVMQEVYLAAAKRLPYFAQNEDVPIYFKLRTILLQTLADIERKNLQAAGRDAYREAEVGDDTASERVPGALNWGQFAADITSPLSRVDRDERHALLRAAVASLPENDRAIRHFTAYAKIHDLLIQRNPNAPEGAQFYKVDAPIRRIRAAGAYSAYHLGGEPAVSMSNPNPRFLWAWFADAKEAVLVLLNDTDSEVKETVSVKGLSAKGREMLDGAQFDFSGGTCELAFGPRAAKFISFTLKK